MLRSILKGTTSVSTVIRIIDSTDGTPETGVENNTPGLSLEYRRDVIPGSTPLDVVSITPAALALLTTAWTEGGIEHIGNGYYRIDPPDLAFAAGADGVMIEGTVTGMIIIGVYHPLTTFDPYDAGLGIFLDQLIAAPYNSTTPDGDATALLNEMTQDDGTGLTQYTANALRNTPRGSGAPEAVWRWDITTTAVDPGVGNVKGDNAAFASITEVYISSTTDSNGAAEPYLSALQIGDTLILSHDDNPPDFFSMAVTGTVDNTGWWTVTGNILDSNGTFGNNNSIRVTMVFAAGTVQDITNSVWEDSNAARVTAGSAGVVLGERMAEASIDTTAGKVDGVALVDVTTTNTDMRGTELAALATVATELRLAELDPANLPADVAAIDTAPMRGTDNAGAAVQDEPLAGHTAVGTVGEANNLVAQSAAAIVGGLVTAGTLTTTAVSTDLTEGDGTLVGRTIIFTPGGTVANVQYSDEIVSNISGVVTWTNAAPTAPSATDPFVIV